MNAAERAGVPRVHIGVHSRVELADGHAASFREWFAAVDWLSEMVPGGELDGAGRVFSVEGDYVGVCVDRFDADGAPVNGEEP